MGMKDNRIDRTLVGQGLVKDFGTVRALAGVDITIPSGQAMAIMGHKLPPGADECTAAREAFDIELREERGK